MLERLAELSARSAELRRASLDKEAGIMDIGLRAGTKALGFARRNPMTALGLGATAAFAPGAVKGSYQQHKAGFDPSVQQAMLGGTPMPPRM